MWIQRYEFSGFINNKMTNNEKKHIKQLQQKKYRNRFGEFVVEGIKSIRDFLQAGFEPVKIYSTTEISEAENNIDKLEIIDKKTLRQISFLKNPKDALAVFKIPQRQELPDSGWIIALDGLQDPGNLGTIIRTADWFGIKNIVCSEDTVDCYNPKVVQATMGSLAHLKVYYADLPVYLSQTNLPVYGACMEGENIYQTRFPNKGILVIGNEGNGISTDIKQLISNKVHIPKHPDSTAESLNAAVAATIFVNEIVKLEIRS